MKPYVPTNLTELYTQNLIPFNESGELSLDLINGTGSMKMGYISSFCRVEGADLFLQLQIIQTVFIIIIFLLVMIYVSLYLWRYVNND